MPATIEKLRIQCRHRNHQGWQCPPDALENEEYCRFHLPKWQRQLPIALLAAPSPRSAPNSRASRPRAPSTATGGQIRREAVMEPLRGSSADFYPTIAGHGRPVSRSGRFFYGTPITEFPRRRAPGSLQLRRWNAARRTAAFGNRRVAVQDHIAAGATEPRVLASGFTGLENLQRVAIANTGPCAPNDHASTDRLDTVDDLTPDPMPACAPSYAWQGSGAGKVAALYRLHAAYDRDEQILPSLLGRP